MKSIKKTPIIVGILSLIALFAYAKQEKVLQIFRNGEIIQEYAVDDIDYIEVHDLIAAPTDVSASVTNDQIIIKWNPVEGATYNVYRSPDNIDFALLASDLTETTYTDTKPLRGSNFYRVKAVVDGNESKESATVAATNADTDLSSGIYLGIYGFSKGFQTHPIQCLTDENEAEYHDFINNISATEPNTWLYYAVDKSIDYLQSTSLPADLTDVAIVTFTDGLDVGSLDEKDKEEFGKYVSNAEYREAMHTRLTSEKVSSVDISAYTIGVLDGKTSNLTTFRNNMNSLATAAENVFEVQKMENVYQVFEQIANSLSETNYVQQFVLSISGLGQGELCRFTFDDVTSHNASKLYIEGTFRRSDRALTNIKYVGLTSSSGNEVVGVLDNETEKYDYTFKGLKAADGTLISTTNVQHWFTDDGIWQDVDDEFFFNPDDATLEKIKRSAAIMLNLDCSSSMNGEKFTSLQTAVNNFVNILYDNSVDPSEVTSVSLNKTELSLPVGETTTLTATVHPATAKLKTVTWESMNPSVATIDNNGNVTAVSPGSTSIIVKTVDGDFTASCQVNVFIPVNSVTLNYTSIELFSGETMTIEATILPETADFKDVIWQSSNENVATVNSDGVVTAKEGGTATITATTIDGTNLKATCNVSVRQYISDISFSASSKTLCLQDAYKLNTIIYPPSATELDLEWESSDSNIATISQEGIVTAVSTGSVNITVTSLHGNFQAQCTITVVPAVNLGLSIPWATYNLGAESPEEYGSYYAWGEVNSKSSFSHSNYRWMLYYSDSDAKLLKYNSNKNYGIVDNKNSLDSSDDAAYMILGTKWRTPSSSEWEELIKDCSWTWTTQNGHNGYIVRSKIPGYTDRQIFIPAAGGYDLNSSIQYVGSIGFYMANNLYNDANAYIAAISNTQVLPQNVPQQISHLGRVCGMSVRAVLTDY